MGPDEKREAGEAIAVVRLGELDEEPGSEQRAKAEYHTATMVEGCVAGATSDDIADIHQIALMRLDEQRILYMSDRKAPIQMGADDLLAHCRIVERYTRDEYIALRVGADDREPYQRWQLMQKAAFPDPKEALGGVVDKQADDAPSSESDTAVRDAARAELWAGIRDATAARDAKLAKNKKESDEAVKKVKDEAWANFLAMVRPAEMEAEKAREAKDAAANEELGRDVADLIACHTR